MREDIQQGAATDVAGLSQVEPANAVSPLRASIPSARPLEEWTEEDGDVLWWKFPIEEAPYSGSPNDCGRTCLITLNLVGEEHVHSVNIGGWPGYHTHWTPIVEPDAPRGETRRAETRSGSVHEHPVDVASSEFEAPASPLHAEIARLSTALADSERMRVEDKDDAERFRALMRCGRVKPQGSCGVDPITGERRYPESPGAVHFGAEFWVQPEAEPSQFTIWGRHCLRALADDILAFEAASTTPKETTHVEG